MTSELVTELVIFLKIGKWVRDHHGVSADFDHLVFKVEEAFDEDYEREDVDEGEEEGEDEEDFAEAVPVEGMEFGVEEGGGEGD